jgi:hypothetical protein
VEITPQGPANANVSSDINQEKLQWPGETFKLSLEGKECEGMNDGEKKRITCVEHEKKSTSDLAILPNCGGDTSRKMFHPAVYCDY